MKRRILIVLSVLLFIIVGGYLYLRFGVLKAKDYKPDVSKEKNEIDLRPSIIAKLQQLVKDGSNGLYVLSIDKIEPHVLDAKLDVLNASIHVDTAAMLRLDKMQLLPDDIFTFHFKDLHIDGIGINDLLHTNRIDIAAINVLDPVINVYHKNRSYNLAERERKENQTLYQKLKGQMKKIAIGNINIKNGTFVNHNLQKNKLTKINDLSIAINDLLIDSTTQFDTKRFFFAKHVTLSTKNFNIPTPDSLYNFTFRDIAISGDQHTINAQNVELKPRYTRDEFEKRSQYRKEMYHMIMKNVKFDDVDWMSIINNERFVARDGEISGGTFTIFLDRSKPQNPTIKMDNFPHQLLMTVPVPLSLTKLQLKNINLSYEEHSPESQQNGIAYFDNINAQLNYVSNIPAEIRKHPSANFSGTALFMHLVPMSAKFKLDLSKARTGDFTADVHMDEFDSATINPIAEPLGLFSVKRGIMQKADAHIVGNNFGTKGTLAMEYVDLHITPLKQDKQHPGNLKSKKFTSFFANKILIKDKNTSEDNDLRKPEYTMERDHHGNFFNMIWMTMLTGVLKTIGIPVKMVIK